MKLKLFPCLSIAALLLAGCAQKVPNAQQSSNTTLAGAAIGAVPGAVIGGVAFPTLGTAGGAAIGAAAGAITGYALGNTTNLEKNINASGARVIKVGDNITILLPTDYVFDNDATDIRPSYDPVMSDIARLLTLYGARPVNIIAYTDNVMSGSLNYKVSKEQALRVASYLWDHGVPYKRLKVVGAGDNNSVATNHNLIGSSENRRIEIYMRRNA